MNNNQTKVGGGGVRICHGYDFLDGKKIYCMKHEMNDIRVDNSEDILSACIMCDSKAYCTKHSKDHLRILFNDMLCIKCFDKEYLKEYPPDSSDEEGSTEDL